MKRGDIVLAHFPQAGTALTKNRPALVVQGDFYNQRIGNVLLAAVTSNLSRKHDPAHFLIDVATPEGRQSGLISNSLVSCLNLAVLPKGDIGPKIGELSADAMLEIDGCLKAALGITQ